MDIFICNILVNCYGLRYPRILLLRIQLLTQIFYYIGDSFIESIAFGDLGSGPGPSSDNEAKAKAGWYNSLMD